MPNVFVHDPSAVLDYGYNWSAWLASGETISSHVVTVPAGLTLASSTESAGVVTAWISATANGEYAAACKIVTSAGRTDERSITIQVRDR